MSKAKKMDWPPERRPKQQHRKLTFIPNIFKIAGNEYPPFDKNDPFIKPAVLKDHCSLLATNREGVPNFLANNSAVDDVINFSEKDWNDITSAQIKWEKKGEEQEKKEQESRDIEDQKLQQKEVADSHIKETLDRKVDLIFTKHFYFIKKTCPVMIPYKSSLNHDEHKAYLRAFVKFKIRSPVTAVESAEYENYLRLQNRVYEEQQCFMRFAYQVSRLQLKVYNEIPDVITEYIDEYVRDRCKRVSSYKPVYALEQSIPICPQDPENRFSDLYFNHLGHLLSLGNVPWIKLPNPHTLCCLPLDNTVKKKERKLEPEDVDKFLHKRPVSEDPNAIYLAKEHQANIVVSTSALKVITDNAGPNFDKEWDIPVVVRSYSITDSEGKEKQHRVVFVDKPMPKKIWTPSEKKQRFYKKSALSSMTEIKRIQHFRMKCPLNFKIERIGPEAMENMSKEKTAAEYTEDFLDLYSATDNDVFGHSPPPKKSKTSKKRKSECLDSSISAMDHETTSMKENSGVGDNCNASVTETSSGSVNSEGNELNSCEATKESNKITANLENSSVNNDKCGEVKIKKQKSNKSAANLENSQANNDKCGEVKIKKQKSNKSAANLENSQANNDKHVEVNTIENNSQSASVPNDTSSVLDNLLDMQDSLLKPTCSNSSPLKQEQDEHAQKMKKSWPWSDTLETDWDKHTEAINCKNWSGDNVHYQLFSMGFNNSKPFSTSQPLRIIVRHGLHGLSRFKSRQGGSSKAFVVHPKPEYQVYFGCEVNTLSEITQQWLDLLVRPNTSLLEVRTCQTTGDIMMSEEKTFASVLKEGKQQHINFTPQQPLSAMYAVFNTLSALPTGDYVLHHDIKTEAFIKLMKSTDYDKSASIQTFDLHSAYSTTSVYTRTHAKPPWIALDTHKLTAFHLKHYKIPGTFPMDNPTKKLSKRDKKKIKDKAQHKQRLADLEAGDPEKKQMKEDN